MKNSVTIRVWNQKSRQMEESEVRLDIERIECIEVSGGFRYEAVMSDGSRQVVRAKATRRYSLAHVHNGVACTGKTGLGAVTNFGAKPTYPSFFRQSFPIVQI